VERRPHRRLHQQVSGSGLPDAAGVHPRDRSQFRGSDQEQNVFGRNEFCHQMSGTEKSICRRCFQIQRIFLRCRISKKHIERSDKVRINNKELSINDVTNLKTFWTLNPQSILRTFIVKFLTPYRAISFQGSISTTNLRTAFMPEAPKGIRIQSSCQYLFTLLGSTGAKAVHRTLMKCTPGWPWKYF